MVDDGTTCADIVNIVRDASSTVGLQDTSQVSVKIQIRKSGTLVDACTTNTAPPPCSGSSSGDSVYVTATYTHTLTFPFSPPQISAHGDGEFRCEFS